MQCFCCFCETNQGSQEGWTLTVRKTSAIVTTEAPNGTVTYDTNLPGRVYMPVSKNDPYYNMNHQRRGKAVIFNFDKWDNTSIDCLGLEPRKGSQKDKKDLAECLRKLGFEVEAYDNLKHSQMWKTLKNVRKANHTEADCLLVVVMTHGERNTIYTGDGAQFPVNLIWEEFEANKCPSLAGKPKIFIIQACRGSRYDSGTPLHSQEPPESETSDVTDAASFSYVIPNAADIIVAFSCPIGHYSWRNPKKGSWFIQGICKVFTKHFYEMDLQMLFTTVAREVALNYQSKTDYDESNNKKQVTSTSSTLIRTVRFEPKIQTELSPLEPCIEEIIEVEREPLNQDAGTFQSIHNNSTKNETINSVDNDNTTAQIPLDNEFCVQNETDVDNNEFSVLTKNI